MGSNPITCTKGPGHTLAVGFPTSAERYVALSRVVAGRRCEAVAPPKAQEKWSGRPRKVTSFRVWRVTVTL